MFLLALFGLLGGLFADWSVLLLLTQIDQNVIWEPVRNAINLVLVELSSLI